MHPGNAFCLRFSWIWVGGELESVSREIFLRNLHHRSQGRMSWCQEYVIVTVTVYTGVDTVDIAAIAAVLKDIKELVAVETIGESG